MLILEKSCGELNEFGSNSTDSIWLPCWKFREKVIALGVGRNLEPTSLSRVESGVDFARASDSPNFEDVHSHTDISLHGSVSDRSCELNWKNSYRALAISIFKRHTSSITLLTIATWGNHWVIVGSSEIAKIGLHIRCIYIKAISMRIVGVNWRDRSTYSTNKWPNLI